MRLLVGIVLLAAGCFGQARVGIYSRYSEVRPEYRRVAAAFAGMPVDRLRAADVAAGALDRVKVLVVAETATADIDLGDAGRERIRGFVERGGIEVRLAKGAPVPDAKTVAAVPGLKEALERLAAKAPDDGGAARVLPRATAGKIRVAVYDDGGIGDPEAGLVMQGNLRVDSAMWSAIVGAADIRAGALDGFDAVIFPGGSGGGTATALGEDGREQVKRFVARGGAFLGFCAGAYLGSAGYPWSLHLLNANSVGTKYWARGGALSEVAVEPLARKLFPEIGHAKRLFQVFWQGPMLEPGDETDRPGFEVPLRFVSDIHHRAAASAGTTPGKPWMALSADSKVRVLLSSGHPESTPGSRYMIARMVRWLLRGEVVSYGEYMQPRKYAAEMMFDKVWSARRARDVAALKEGASVEDAEAALRRIAVDVYAAHHFVPGFLRSRHARLRRVAAELIVEMQMFWTDRDLEVALAAEPDAETRRALGKALRYVRVAPSGA